ncbi:hypothetical protein DFQ28_004965 [Apophysomyces sp. BC1034]|nr:hypothetical protein DFQ30_002966 [Apophysomyces sp. BC1015]KAG0180124.1 hypothetical protein DFQ29_001186 [Apophysomyces sp. BC1021]KAG0188339.1 hypothetical protein DFQ28_004965 [Apophysomyces sp. BC1034]
MSVISPNNPPFPAYRATEKGSFAWDSTVRRWPIIIDSALVEINEALQKQSEGASQREGQKIIESMKLLKAEIAADKPLRLLQDDEKDTRSWNEHIKKHFPEATWFSGTWLFNECYMYRRIRECFSITTHWRDFDPFSSQKEATFRGSHRSVFELARKMPLMIEPMGEEKLEIVYNELIQVCLWGNATDLSLLTNMTEEDIQRLQAIEEERLAEQKKFIVVDNIDALWTKLKSIKDGRVDFVLDNSGFEVYVDLILADWLLQTKTASKVVFHCKTIPWFVSDVMPKDVPTLFECCLDPQFFPASATRPVEDVEALETMVMRWKDYVGNGQLVISSHDFWCSGLPYCYLNSEAPELFKDMATSDLVIFKGDLNFRKLVFDCDWPVTTPFKKAIGEDMGQRFTNIVSLRTNKADPIVGLREGQKEEIEKHASHNEWRCSGKYAVVEFN